MRVIFIIFLKIILSRRLKLLVFPVHG